MYPKPFQKNQKFRKMCWQIFKDMQNFGKRWQVLKKMKYFEIRVGKRSKQLGTKTNVPSNFPKNQKFGKYLDKFSKNRKFQKMCERKLRKTYWENYQKI